MRLFKKIAGVWGAVVSFLFIGGVAFAQIPASSISLTNPLDSSCNSGASGGQCFLTVMNNVINFLLADVAIPLAVIMVLVGAFQMMTSAGDPEKFSKGRKTLLYAAIGFVVALLATGVTGIIKSILGQ